MQKNLQDSRVHLRTLKFDLASGKIKNISEIHKVKKNIARILTVINMK
ncbi:MAG: 50S ribosomal protein L29 [bacterium]|nr:50S ribosomal protein L29 [bacterium]